MRGLPEDGHCLVNGCGAGASAGRHDEIVSTGLSGPGALDSLKEDEREITPWEAGLGHENGRGRVS